MNKRTYLECFAGATTMIAVLLAPTSLFAGNYGSAGVSDAPVSQYAGQSQVWCQRLEANVPGKLYEQMDCGPAETGMARDAVAGERITNRPRTVRGFFSNFRHVPGGGIATDDDNPAPRVTTIRDDGPNPTPTPSPTPSSNATGKWDRLNDLGVTRQNFDDQSKGFKDQFKDYRSTNGGDGDWSDFNPD